MEQRLARPASSVAQIFNLLYRRLAVCRASDNFWHLEYPLAQPATRVAQIFNLLYRRVALGRLGDF